MLIKSDHRSSSASESLVKRTINQTHLNSYELELSKNQSFRIMKMNSIKSVVKERTTNSLKLDNRKDSGISFVYTEREKLIQDLQSCKQELNLLREENQKLKTHLTNSEKELLKFEKMLEEQTNQRNNKYAQSSEFFTINLRRQVKELQSQIKDKCQELEILKKNSKITKMQEMESEKRVYFEETVRLNDLLKNTTQRLSIVETQLYRYNSIELDLLKTTQLKESLRNQNQSLLEQCSIQEGSQMTLQIQIQQVMQQHSQKCKQYEQRIERLQQEVTRLRNANLSLREKSKRDSYTKKFIISSRESSVHKSQTEIQSTIQKEIQYRLIYKGVAPSDLASIFDGYKEIYKVEELTLDHLRNILAQQPFSLIDIAKIDKILQNVDGQDLVNSFINFVGSYRPLYEIPNDQIEKDQKQIKKALDQKQKKIQNYLLKQRKPIKLVDLESVVQANQLDITERQRLIYIMSVQVFQCSEDQLENIPHQSILNPFDDKWTSDGDFLSDLNLNDLNEQEGNQKYYQIDQDDMQFHQSLRVKSRFTRQDFQEIKEESEEHEHENIDDVNRSKRQTLILRQSNTLDERLLTQD